MCVHAHVCMTVLIRGESESRFSPSILWPSEIELKSSAWWQAFFPSSHVAILLVFLNRLSYLLVVD